jgi:hypothetical protein
MQPEIHSWKTVIRFNHNCLSEKAIPHTIDFRDPGS